MKTFSSILIGCQLLTLAALAQQPTDVCSNVLVYAGRDTNDVSYAATIAKSLYTQECNGETMRNGAEGEIGIEAVIKAIPFKFNAGGNTTSEKITRFCKTVHDYYASDTHYNESDSTVVREALVAWSDCVHAKEVQFMPIVGDTQVLLGLRLKIPAEVTVNGVTYDPKLLACTVPNEKGMQVTADKDSIHTLSKKDWTITCNRIPTIEGTTTEYPHATLSVVTSAGNFMLPIPANAQQSRRWSVEFEDAIAAQTRQINDLASQTQLECKSTYAVSNVQAYPYAVAEIPADLPDRDKYIVTGGGCGVTNNPTHGPPPYGHNPPIVVSTYAGNTWQCVGGDPPDKPTSFSLTATVIYCRVKK